MGEIFRDIYSRKYFFFSNENDEPMHIHVEQAERSAKYWMETPLRLQYNHKFRSKELREIERIIEMNRELITERWNENKRRKNG